MADDTEQLLRRVPLFEGIEPRALAALAALAHPRSYARGELIFREGEDGVGMYVIASGRVLVFHERNGVEDPIKEEGPGEVFGEISLLVDHPRIASVKAIEPTTCLIMTAWSFRQALDGSPHLARQMLTHVARWLVEAEDRSAAIDRKAAATAHI
ncbi:MAG: family transcriptional regulator, cyclic receptor protein [Chloroflexota bacterium]|jgi:CRP-like cAMP-binding protein|nr:family transcriptional regulator, cyclic receptor protein [Chloroflexota bacterium]